MYDGFRQVIIGFCIVGLTACSDAESVSALQAQLTQIKQRPQGDIEKPPTFKFYEGFAYSASSLRSPFVPPMSIDFSKIPASGKKVQPDLKRMKEPLEEYTIESLTMVGSLKQAKGVFYALIADKAGSIHQVRVGNYLGKNYGRIVKVSEESVDLIEVVPDAGAWVERPRSLMLSEAQSSSSKNQQQNQQ